MSVRRISVLSLVLFVSIPVFLHAAAIDSTLFTTYTINSPQNTQINFSVCGSLPTSEGCYAAGAYGPFGRVGAMIEGNPTQNLKQSTVTRYVYILDVGFGSKENEVALYVYKRVDSITSGTDTVTVTLFKTVTLPLTGGTATVPSLAANKNYILIGTNQDNLAVEVKKSNLSFVQVGGSSGLTVSSITPDEYGYITVTWGTTINGFVVIGPNGAVQENGGGPSFMLNTNEAILTSALP